MKKLSISILMAMFLTFVICPFMDTTVHAAGTNYCVLMKFVNNTRFKRLAPEIKLSDLVMEKLVSSGKIKLKETRPIDKKIFTELYDANARSERVVAKAEKGNFNDLFENKQAASISEAYQGQSISPELTSRIGKAHGADFLIQGTILNVARGASEDQKTSMAAGLAGIFAGKMGGSAGNIAGDILRNTNKIYTGVNIQCDLRVIKSSTGEVVWSKMVTSASKQEKLKVGDIFSSGSDQMSMNLYELALDQAAQKIADELLNDVDKGILQL